MRRVILAVVGTVAGLVLLLGFKTHATTASALGKSSAIDPAPGSGTGSASSAGSGGASSASGSDSTGGSSGNSASGAKTATGQEVQTQYGPVQVKVTVSNGKITSAVATEYPTERPRDVEINNYAVPQLQQETIAANSATIDVVSGATYTSEGYIQSLQSALDQLH